MWILIALAAASISSADSLTLKECNSRFGVGSGTAIREPDAPMNDILFNGDEQRGGKPKHNECGKFATSEPEEKLPYLENMSYQSARRLVLGLVKVRKNVIDATEYSNTTARKAEEACAVLEKDFANTKAIADFKVKLDALTIDKHAAQVADEKFVKAAKNVKAKVEKQRGGEECGKRLQKWIDAHECFKIQNIAWLESFEARCKKAQEKKN